MPSCPGCGANVSAKAGACPECGYALGGRVNPVAHSSGDTLIQPKYLVGIVLIVMTVGLLFAIPYFSVPRPPSKSTLDARRAEKKDKYRETARKQKIEFERNKDKLIDKYQKMFAEGKFSAIVRETRQYVKFNNTDIQHVRGKAREMHLLATVKDISESNVKAKRDTYVKLARLNPTNKKYEASRKLYQNKFEEDALAQHLFQSHHGDAPVKSAWSGSYPEVEQYLKTVANDPASIDINSCTDVYKIDDGWLVGCDYRGKNAFGATVKNSNWFTISQNRVIKMSPASAYKP